MSREGGQERGCRYHQYACWGEPRFRAQHLGHGHSDAPLHEGRGGPGLGEANLSCRHGHGYRMISFRPPAGSGAPAKLASPCLSDNDAAVAVVTTAVGVANFRIQKMRNRLRTRKHDVRLPKL
jgi:hypothetical protein